MSKTEMGIEVGGRRKVNVGHLLFADDIVILTDDKMDLQLQLDKCKTFARNNGLKYNVKKCAVMTIQGKRKNRKAVYEKIEIKF